VLTSAGPDFDAPRDLPDVACFVRRSSATTRFVNTYHPDGSRAQVLAARAGALDLGLVPDEWRCPDVLLLGPVAGELGGRVAQAFQAECVGALAQGWLREVDGAGCVSPRAWRDPQGDLAGVHAVFFSEHDLPEPGVHARELLGHVPIVVLTRGWEGASVHTRDAIQQVAALPREEVDPTGAGDVFASAFLLRYHETADLMEAGAFAACAASCVVEQIGAAGLGDRDELLWRMDLRRRLIEEGDWDE